MAELLQPERRQDEKEEKQQKSSAAAECLKEHEKLDVLLSKIPKKAQTKFIMTCDLILTCIDADSSYIVLGSNVGLVFVFSREDDSLNRIKITGANDIITSVKLHNGTDHLLAVGTSSGHFNIYCFPSKTSALINKEVQKFEIKEVHKYITCLEWSTNGMKLYSGDTKGNVVVTEVDFYEGKCASVVLLIDAGNEIVQLSYDHKVLAVSTVEKSYVVRVDLNCQVVNTGSEDLMMKGMFGSCFIPGLCKTEDALLYTARPDCFLWISDMKGNVKNMQAFGALLSSEAPEIFLLSSETNSHVSVNNSHVSEDIQFGKLKMFRDKELVTWSNTALVILDPKQNKVVACQSKFENIVDVAVVNSGEIFVLQRSLESRLIRIANRPEFKLGKTQVPPLIPKLEEKVEDKNSNSALNFFKKNLGNPLKKLDLHINSVSERVIISENIPNAKVLTEIETPTESNEQNEEKKVLHEPQNLNENVINQAESNRSRSESIQAESNRSRSESIQAESNESPAESIQAESNESPAERNHIESNENPSECIQYQEKDEGGIVFSIKEKRNKKKQHKKGNRVVKMKAIDTEAKDDIAVTEEDKSTMDILNRADSLLERLNFNSNFDNVQVENAKEICDDGLSINSDASQSVKSEDVNYDSSIKTVADLNSNDTHEHHQILDRFLNSHTDDKNDSTTFSNRDLLGVPSSSFNTLGNSCLSVSVENALDTLDSVRKSDLAERNPQVEGKEAELEQVKGGDGLEESGVIESPEPNLYSQCFFKSDSICDDEPKPLRPSLMKDDSLDIEYYSELMQDIDTLNDETLLSSISNDAIDDPTNAAPKLDSNIWTTFDTPSKIYSVSISDLHIWYTDKNENIYYSELTERQDVKWKKASGKANQISVSPSGDIVRCLHKNVVLACVKQTSRHPEGVKWVEHLNSVDCISVDNQCVWYITQSGMVMVETNVSKERPLSKPRKIPCPDKLKIILSCYGVVWAITDRLQLLVRRGITASCVEGNDWELYTREEPPFLFSHVAIGHDQVGWAVDILGQVWFCTGVTRKNPLGHEGWCQVPLSESVHHDNNTRNLIKEVALKFDPVKFSLIISSTSQGNLVTAGKHGLWLAVDFQNVFYVCRGNIQGFQWMDAQISQLSSSNGWKHLCASISHTDLGCIWAQHASQGLHVFKRGGGFSGTIDERDDISCLSCNESTLWAVTLNGSILARDDFDHSMPVGSSWQMLNLEQLGDVHIVHMSCSSLYLWAVDSDGIIYHRIGARAPVEDELSPVWLPIDCFSHLVFTHIYSGVEEWMVWAIDNQRLIYTRRAISDTMPIGTEWVHVSGIQARDMTVTKSGVWALSETGEVFYRQKVRRDRVEGSYWSKIPGLFSKISASANDELWGVTMEGELKQCEVQHITRMGMVEDVPSGRSRLQSACSPSKDDPDWELL